jgi:hypothetical protein
MWFAEALEPSLNIAIGESNQMLITITMANIVNFNQSLLSPYTSPLFLRPKKGEGDFLVI